MGKPLTFLVKRSALKFHVKTRILMVRWITAKLRLEANDDKSLKSDFFGEPTTRRIIKVLKRVDRSSF